MIWRAQQEAQIAATTTVKQLAPGAYTAIVRGMRDSTGTALIEAYHLPE